MINNEKKAEIKTRLRGGDPVAVTLEGLSHDELRSLRCEIDGLLPRDDLKGLDLEEELVEQYRLVKNLQSDALHDDKIPLNQRVQLAGQVAATVEKLFKMQVDMQREEQLKRMETAFLSAIDTMPEEYKTLFFEEYERIADSLGATA